MRILILTSISPVICGDSYVRIANNFSDSKTKKNTNFLSFPVFAEIHASIENKEYLPSVFSMMKAALKSPAKEKLFDNKHTVVVGNSYKNLKFDIVATLDYHEDEVFDTYIESLRTDEDYKEFADLVKLDNLYSPADAEIHLPTISHAILFLEEALKEDDTKKQSQYKLKS